VGWAIHSGRRLGIHSCPQLEVRNGPCIPNMHGVSHRLCPQGLWITVSRIAEPASRVGDPGGVLDLGGAVSEDCYVEHMFLFDRRGSIGSQ